jgi:hypothetical protein
MQESAVTCCEYLVDCPANIIPALYTVGSRGKGQVNKLLLLRHLLTHTHLLSSSLDLKVLSRVMDSA